MCHLFANLPLKAEPNFHPIRSIVTCRDGMIGNNHNNRTRLNRISKDSLGLNRRGWRGQFQSVNFIGRKNWTLSFPRAFFASIKDDLRCCGRRPEINKSIQQFIWILQSIRWYPSSFANVISDRHQISQDDYNEDGQKLNYSSYSLASSNIVCLIVLESFCPKGASPILHFLDFTLLRNFGTERNKFA